MCTFSFLQFFKLSEIHVSLFNYAMFKENICNEIVNKSGPFWQHCLINHLMWCPRQLNFVMALSPLRLRESWALCSMSPLLFGVGLERSISQSQARSTPRVPSALLNCSPFPLLHVTPNLTSSCCRSPR